MRKNARARASYRTPNWGRSGARRKRPECRKIDTARAFEDWQNRIIDESTAPRFFNGGTQNIGIQLGPASHGLTDVDLDCAQAVAIAPYILPPTGAIFGRATKRASHWLYITDLSVESHTAAVQFKAPAGP